MPARPGSVEKAFETSRNCFNLSTHFIAKVLYSPGMCHPLPQDCRTPWSLDPLLSPLPGTALLCQTHWDTKDSPAEAAVCRARPRGAGCSGQEGSGTVELPDPGAEAGRRHLQSMDW